MKRAKKGVDSRRSMSSKSRGKAYAAINICWKQISPDGHRDERLAWVAEFLGLPPIQSLKDLMDHELGEVAAEMKRLTGGKGEKQKAKGKRQNEGNVVRGDFGRRSEIEGPKSEIESETVFLAGEEQVYTLKKLDEYIGWSAEERDGFLKKRFKTANFRRMTFKQATSATNMLLHIAAHKDLKRSKGEGQPVSRIEINKYIPKLKSKLSIDRQARNK